MSPKPGSKWPAFIAVFLVAFAVRAGFLFVLAPLAPSIAPSIAAMVGKTFDGYHDIALQLISGHGFAFDPVSGPTAGRAPLYPLFLAAMYRVFGTGFWPVLWIHAILGALTCSMLYLVGHRMFDRRVGVLGGILLAVYPPHVWWSQYILSETMLVFLIVSAFLRLLILAEHPSVRHAIASGALFGLTALCNAMILFFPPLLVLTVLLSRERRRRYLRPALVMLATMAIVIVPWTVRNALTFHRLIPVNWSFGWVYFDGLLMVDEYVQGQGRDLGALNTRSTEEVIQILRAHGFTRTSLEDKRIAMSRTMCVDFDEDQLLKRLAVEQIRKNPYLAVRKFVVNLGLYWYLAIRYQGALKLLNFTLVGLALLGLARGAWRLTEARLMVLYSLYFYFSYAAVLASSRFVVQIAPFLALLGAAAIASFARRRTAPPA